MSNNALSPRRGSVWFAVAPVLLLLGGVTILAQETTLDLRESTPIFRRSPSRRSIAANSNTTTTQAPPATSSPSVARRSNPQPYANAPSAEADSGAPAPLYASNHASGAAMNSDGAALSESSVSSTSGVDAESGAPSTAPAGKARRSNPDVSPLLPLPNWEGSDVPVQAPSSMGQGRMIGESPSANYILNPSDYVRILVYQEPDLATETRISKDGSINFPLLGMTHIGGKTVNEAVELIRKKLDTDFLVNPQITLTVLEYSRARFTILGEVNHPGTYDIPREETVTLLDAVASAGGFTRTARTTSVTVKRKIDGRENVIKIDARQMARESTASFNILPGDTITVPTTIF